MYWASLRSTALYCIQTAYRPHTDCFRSRSCSCRSTPKKTPPCTIYCRVQSIPVKSIRVQSIPLQSIPAEYLSPVFLHCISCVSRPPLRTRRRFSKHQAAVGGLHCTDLQYIAVQCSTVQCSAVQCSAVQCSAVQCSALQCSAVQYYVLSCPSMHCVGASPVYSDGHK